MNAFSIRRARPGDAPALSALIRRLAHHFTLHDDGRGAERFFTTVTPMAIAGYIGDPAFDYRVGELGGQLVGSVALRDERHLYHLFVSPAFQGRGLARALWTAIRDAAPDPHAEFTVNASPNAVAVYARFGFVATGPRVETHGIAFIPMRLAARPAAGQ